MRPFKIDKSARRSRSHAGKDPKTWPTPAARVTCDRNSARDDHRWPQRRVRRCESFSDAAPRSCLAVSPMLETVSRPRRASQDRGVEMCARLDRYGIIIEQVEKNGASITLSATRGACRSAAGGPHGLTVARRRWISATSGCCAGQAFGPVLRRAARRRDQAGLSPSSFVHAMRMAGLRQHSGPGAVCPLRNACARVRPRRKVMNGSAAAELKVADRAAARCRPGTRGQWSARSNRPSKMRSRRRRRGRPPALAVIPRRSARDGR